MKKNNGWWILLGAVGVGWLIWKFRKGQEGEGVCLPERAYARISLELDDHGGCRFATPPVRPDPLDLRQQQEVNWIIDVVGLQPGCEDLEVSVRSFAYSRPLEKEDLRDLSHAAPAAAEGGVQSPLELSDEERASARQGGRITDRVRADATVGYYKYNLQLARNGDPIQVIDPEVRVREWP